MSKMCVTPIRFISCCSYKLAAKGMLLFLMAGFHRASAFMVAPVHGHTSVSFTSTEESRTYQGMHIERGTSAATSGHLLCELNGGVTNQANEADNCIRLAALTHRTLVMPRLRTAQGIDHPYPGRRYPFERSQPLFDETSWPGTDSTEFGQIWNESQYTSYAKSMGVKVIAADTWAAKAGDVTMAAYLPGDGERWRFFPLAANGTALKEHSLRKRSTTKAEKAQHALVSRTAHVATLLVITPYNTLTKMAGVHGSACCQPSAALWDEKVRVRNTLPAGYTCLHLRAERDWLVWCCSEYQNKNGWDSILEGHNTSSNVECLLANGLCPDGSAPSTSCYSDEAIVTEFLIADQHVEGGSALFVATGLPAKQLPTLSSTFDVRHGASLIHLPAGTTDQFMDYASATVQKMICVDAQRFFGNSGSSFSGAIYSQRIDKGSASPGVYYNDKKVVDVQKQDKAVAQKHRNANDVDVCKEKSAAV